ncbi:MAG: energy coupling factor transporter S component ThiW [Thermoproteota archaeon]
MKDSSLSRKVALSAALSAIGIVVSPLGFEWLGSRAFPGQHFVNVLSGVMLGPVWGSIIAIIIGSVRIALGTGTIFAYPGGIPGAVTVGLAFLLTRRFRSLKLKYAAAFAEPLGTVFIGATVSLFIVAPLIGPAIGPAAKMLSNLQTMGPWLALILLWSGWAVSSVTGALVGYVLLAIAGRYGVLEPFVSSDK